ncbi:hypothetical protein F9U41_23070, partial [Pectobacterium versatile]|nr:hypothetical protein [Pectobacterium versatile]
MLRATNRLGGVVIVADDAIAMVLENDASLSPGAVTPVFQKELAVVQLHDAGHDA